VLSSAWLPCGCSSILLSEPEGFGKGSKEIKFKDLPGIIVRSCKTIGLSLALVGFALLFGRVLVIENVPQFLAEGLRSMTENKFVILFLVNFLLFIIGMLLETSSAVTITSPLLLAIVKAYGVDPLHFGVILVFNLCIGLCTPPVGQSLFVTTGIAKIRIQDTFKPLVPCVIASLVALTVVTYCEPLVLFLPDLINGR
jgi:C4-dicarboxylate transporter DctM subunit